MAVTLNEAHGFVSVNTSFGSVKASHLYKGANVVDGNGAIELTSVQGDIYTKTSFGSIYVENVKGKFTGQDSNGSVTGKGIEGDATVNTSFSGVTLEGVSGKISVENQNGAVDVTASGSSCKDIIIKTSFSHIGLRLPGNAGYSLKARTSFGHITSQLPITTSGTFGPDSMEGTIGGGGCTLELSNSNGNIDISRN